MLPDVALLEIFDFYTEARKEEWSTLVHVCQKWRDAVFGSPCRLHLQLICEASSPARKMLGVWPRLPIVVRSRNHNVHGVDNLVAALEHNDRISEILLYHLPSSEFEKVLAVMQQPFPALTRLVLGNNGGAELIDPASFLGGSVPRLRTLGLLLNPLPGLSNLLLSATDLVNLSLVYRSGAISPEALTTCLSVLTRLETLEISLGSNPLRSRPDRRHLPPPTHTHLPVLTRLRFFGVSDYLEDLVAQIDAPLLDNLHITFFYQLIFNTPHLAKFISRTPKFKTYDTVHVGVSAGVVSVSAFDERLRLVIFPSSPSDPVRQLSSLAQVCGSSLPRALISAVEHLCILGYIRKVPLQNGIENSQWLEIFSLFTAVKYLYISLEFTRHVVAALQERVGESVAEVLPALQTLFLQDSLFSKSVQKNIGQFVSTRQLDGHPITISRWERVPEDTGFVLPPGYLKLIDRASPWD